MSVKSANITNIEFLALSSFSNLPSHERLPEGAVNMPLRATSLLHLPRSNLKQFMNLCTFPRICHNFSIPFKCIQIESHLPGSLHERKKDCYCLFQHPRAVSNTEFDQIRLPSRPSAPSNPSRRIVTEPHRNSDSREAGS
jgi:hypothetical protein